MDEKNINLNTFIIGFIAGVIITGTICGIAIGRSVREIADLDRQRDQLIGEYSDRQRIIKDGITECLGIVENAGAIVERTGTNASAAISDLRQAGVFIRQAIEDKYDVQMELDCLRASLYRLGDMDRNEVN